jgi:hypothetical protein
MSDQSFHLQEQKFKQKKKKQRRQQLPDKCMLAAHNKTDVRESERERERERETRPWIWQEGQE